MFGAKTKRIALPVLASLAVALPVVLLLLVADGVHQQQYRSFLRLAALAETDGVRWRLEAALNARFKHLSRLASTVALNPSLDKAAFASLASEAMDTESGILGMCLAPDGVVAHVWPPSHEWLEPGEFLLDKDGHRDSILHALRSRKVALAGPLDFGSEGRVFVCHAAVFRSPDEGPPFSGDYWGLVGVFLDEDALLREAGLLVGDGDLEYAIRGRNGRGASGEVFFGDDDVFQAHPVVSVLFLPIGSWVIAAVPTEGWKQTAPGTAQLRFGGGLFAVLIAVLIGFLVRSRLALGDEFENRMQVEAALHQSEHMLFTLMQNLPGMAYRCRPDRGGSMDLVSNGCLELTGYRPEEFLEGGGVLYADLIHPDDRAEVKRRMEEALAREESYEIAYRLRTKAGTIRWVWEQGAAVYGAEGDAQVVGGFITDMTKRKRIEDNLQVLSQQDTLTCIANRRSFEERFRVEWLRAAANRASLAVVMCDIDYFKPFNDTYGHPEGDRCLKEVARTLEGSLKRASDFVARYGGEEFVMILSQTHMDGAANVAERLRQAVESLGIPHSASPVSGCVTISLGVSVCRPAPNLWRGRLVEAADRALYQAKHEGRNRVATAKMALDGEDDQEGREGEETPSGREGGSAEAAPPEPSSAAAAQERHGR